MKTDAVTYWTKTESNDEWNLYSKIKKSNTDGSIFEFETGYDGEIMKIKDATDKSNPFEELSDKLKGIKPVHHEKIPQPLPSIAKNDKVKIIHLKYHIGIRNEIAKQYQINGANYKVFE